MRLEIEKENNKYVIVGYDDNAKLKTTQLYEIIDGEMGFWDIDNNFDTFAEAQKYLNTHQII